MFQYVSVLRGMTKGRAQYTMQLEKYDVVPPNIQTEIIAKQKTQVSERGSRSVGRCNMCSVDDNVSC
jgi:hypothetical protein